MKLDFHGNTEITGGLGAPDLFPLLRHCSSRTCPSCPTRRCTPNSNLIGDGFADFEVPSFLSYSAFPVVISKSKGSMVRHTRRWHELAETEPPARKSLTLRDLSMLATLVTKAATPSHSVPPENRWSVRGKKKPRRSTRFLSPSRSPASGNEAFTGSKAYSDRDHDSRGEPSCR